MRKCGSAGASREKWNAAWKKKEDVPWSSGLLRVLLANVKIVANVVHRNMSNMQDVDYCGRRDARKSLTRAHKRDDVDVFVRYMH